MTSQKKPRKRSVIAILALLLICSCIGGMAWLLTNKDIEPMPTATPLPKSGRLSCRDCADAGIPINLWQNYGQPGGKVVGHGQHDDPVKIESVMPADGRNYYLVVVTSTGARGWVPETLIEID